MYLYTCMYIHVLQVLGCDGYVLYCMLSLPVFATCMCVMFCMPCVRGERRTVYMFNLSMAYNYVSMILYLMCFVCTVSEEEGL